ncbi:MAG: DUF169 domain-containing protein [Methanobacteriota archaeon]|nr:MAG: DUF169 domain-containing protein [Euryarchaeota archaeon]
MDADLRNRFSSLWKRYFGDAELPIAIFYSDEPLTDPRADKADDRCIIGMLSPVRAGEALSIGTDSELCGGARKYLGFTSEMPMKDFDYFLSTGIPGKLKGERYKKSPEIVRKSMKHSPFFEAPGAFINFVRWDKLTEADNPQIVLFLGNQDVISGLFTLANFDEVEPNAVICPFGSGCSSLVYHPYIELRSSRPRCVIGMFDISARPYLGENIISFAAPITKFERMVNNMEASFLSTDTWKRLYDRIQKTR